ncbi:alpha/beta hydrolase [Actinotalea sp.]|uniref:alpha/beta hydrolase n=1 Tax=Actinotalea sp. TaxID=1872145 RepID=UPI003567337B
MWRPDVLGDGWQARTIPLRPDYQGEAVATLVRRTPDEPRRRAVLYVHGYVDYFFQTHLGEAWAAQGYDFYALDLRAHGRSLLPHQLANDVHALASYAEELDAAARIVREEEGHELLVVQGHSTGGLITALWAQARRDRADGPALDALVLNSPWLDLNRPWTDRVLTTRAVDVLGRVAPNAVVGQLDPHYGAWLSDPDGGGWEYDLSWKPVEGFGVRAGWLRAIRRGHAAVARGLAIDLPILVCTSTRSGPARRWHEALDRTDSVLSVEQTLERAPLLGNDVTVVQIPGGVHDLVLSPEPARSGYLEAVRAWTNHRLGPALG